MTKLYFSLLIWVFIAGCIPSLEDSFHSEQLTSSKGETIYINSLNWGITDDHQMSVVSKSKNRLRERADTLGVVKDLEPFFYTFKNDSLILYFDRDINYTVKDQFRTIHIKYVCLDQEKYRDVRSRAYINDEYHSVPKRRIQKIPSEMPLPPSNYQ